MKIPFSLVTTHVGAPTTRPNENCFFMVKTERPLGDTKGLSQEYLKSLLI
jgi:hypothetical protein